MRAIFWSFLQKRMKRWTRSGIYEFLVENACANKQEAVLVVGGYGPILDYIKEINFSNNIKTLDINPLHLPDYTYDIADPSLIRMLKIKFNYVIMIEVLEHVHDYNLALKNISQLLKTGGKLIATAPLISPLHDIPFDFHRFTFYEVERMLKVNGLANFKIESRGNYLDSILALGVRGFRGFTKFDKFIGILSILFTAILPRPKVYDYPRFSSIGYNIIATHY
jgi:SAM-dependent methyltransferase